LWLTANLTNQSAFAELWLPLVLRGVGMMFIMVPVTNVALGTLAPAVLKNASGLYNLMRNLGGAFGLALINTMATDRSAAHRLHLGEAVNSGRPEAAAAVQRMSDALAARLGENADLAALARVRAMVQREALVLAYNDVLMVMAALFLLAVPLVLLLAKPRAEAGAGGGH